jgi:hypothetical protein
LAFLATEVAVTVRVGLTHAAQTQLTYGGRWRGRWLACITPAATILVFHVFEEHNFHTFPSS